MQKVQKDFLSSLFHIFWNWNMRISVVSEHFHSVSDCLTAWQSYGQSGWKAQVFCLFSLMPISVCDLTFKSSSPYWDTLLIHMWQGWILKMQKIFYNCSFVVWHCVCQIRAGIACLVKYSMIVNNNLNLKSSVKM